MKNKYNIREKTPKEMLCGISSCPSIYKGVRKTTPKEMQCAAAACPSTHKAKKDGKEVYLIIGKTINPKDTGLEKKVGQDESLIEVPKGLIDGIEK